MKLTLSENWAADTNANLHRSIDSEGNIPGRAYLRSPWVRLTDKGVRHAKTVTAEFSRTLKPLTECNI